MKNYYPNMNTTAEQLQRIDLIFGEKSIVILNKIKSEKFVEAKVLYEKIRNFYVQLLKKSNGIDIQTSKDIKIFLNDCKKIIDYRKPIYDHEKRSEKRIKETDLSKDVIFQTEDIKNILNAIINGKSLGEYNYHDFIQAFNLYVTNYDNLNYDEYLTDFIIEIKKNADDETKDYINYLRSVLNKKIKVLNIDEENKLKVLTLKKDIDMLDYSLLTLKKEEIEHDYLYEVINFWLSDDRYEYYILSLIEKYPDIFKLKEEKIIEIVLKKYADACKDELINQKRNAIDKNYYLKVFNALYNNPNYLHKEDKNLECILEELKCFIANGKYRVERKQSIYESITKLTKKEESIKDLRELSSEDFYEALGYVNDIFKDELFNSKRAGLLDDNVIIFGNNQEDLKKYGISINYNKTGNSLLRIHVVDTDSLIYKDTPLDIDAMNNNCLNNKLQSKFSLQVGKKSPVITYQLNIDSKGKIYDFKVFKSIINPVFEVSKETTYDSLKKQELTKEYVKLYKNMEQYYDLHNPTSTLKDINFNIINMLSEVIGSNLEKNNIPCIYRVQNSPNGEEYSHQLTNLNYYLFRLNDETFRTIYEIICNKQNTKAYYSDKPGLHYGTGKKYFIDVVQPFSYVGIQFQRLMDDIYIKNTSLKSLQSDNEELTELINYYNKKFYDIEIKEKGKKKVK